MIFVTMERTPLRSTTSRWLGDFAFFQYNRLPLIYSRFLGVEKDLEESITRSCNRFRGRVSCPVPDKRASTRQLRNARRSENPVKTLARILFPLVISLLGCKLASNGPNTNVGDPKLTDTRARDAADIKTLEERL